MSDHFCDGFWSLRRSLATGKAEGGIKITPLGGLEVGSDTGGAVGPYETPNPFGGTIYTASLKTTR